MQIDRQSEPRSDVKVVERFDLVLDSLLSEPDQLEVVLQNLAQVGIGICDAEFISGPALKEDIAAETGIEKRGDRASTLVG